MDPCLGYVNAYIWTQNCHVMGLNDIHHPKNVLFVP